MGSCLNKIALVHLQIRNQMKKRLFIAILVLGGLIAIVAFTQRGGEREASQSKLAPAPKPLRKVVVNEAARTLLYLPIYHAVERGYFREAGVDLNIITGGTATASFAAMLSDEAAFSLADPMYVPISREKGGETKVVAQVVARIALWGVTLDTNLREMTAETLRNKKLATHPRPMTAYTYSSKFIRDLGLEPDKDVELITSTPGTEIASLFNHQADFMVSVEPNTSKAVAQGAHVVLSFPKLLGDQVLTGLMVKEAFIQENRDLVVLVVRGCQKALNDIRTNPDEALKSAKVYFPQLEEQILRAAIQRLIDDEVFPKSVLISEESWKKAMAVRVSAGDIKSESARADSCALDIMQLGEQSAMPAKR